MKWNGQLEKWYRCWSFLFTWQVGFTFWKRSPLIVHALDASSHRITRIQQWGGGGKSPECGAHHMGGRRTDCITTVLVGTPHPQYPYCPSSQLASWGREVWSCQHKKADPRVPPLWYRFILFTSYYESINWAVTVFTPLYRHKLHIHQLLHCKCSKVYWAPFP